MSTVADKLRKLASVKTMNAMLRLGILAKGRMRSLEELKEEYQANLGERAEMDKKYAEIVEKISAAYDTQFTRISEEEQRAAEEEISLTAEYSLMREDRRELRECGVRNAKESILRRLEGAKDFIIGDMRGVQNSIDEVNARADIRGAHEEVMGNIDQQLDERRQGIQEARAKQKKARKDFKRVRKLEKNGYKNLGMSNFTSKAVAKQMPLHKRIFGKLLSGILGKQRWKTTMQQAVNRAVQFGNENILTTIDSGVQAIGDVAGDARKFWVDGARKTIGAVQESMNGIVTGLDESLARAESVNQGLTADYSKGKHFKRRSGAEERDD